MQPAGRRLQRAGRPFHPERKLHSRAERWPDHAAPRDGTGTEKLLATSARLLQVLPRFAELSRTFS
jgi:hypothetical protein